MPSYDYRDFENLPWFDRFPEWVQGYGAWRENANTNPLERLIEARRARTTRPVRPCVFVSHRRCDVDQAERIAYLACQAGCDYWLDVHDPLLSGVQSSGGLSGRGQAIITAAIIEMGLLNSTHVVAVMTSNTAGSQWVPYEYGRVKDPVPVSLQAACWIEPGMPPPALADYLYLGPQWRTESDIAMWLAKTGSTRPGHSGWKRPVPAALP